jgi:hypothetical protein
MSILRRLILPFILGLLSVGGAAWAQCPEGMMRLDEAIEKNDTLQKLAVREALLETNATVALAVASATQIEAPSNAGGSSEVNLPGFASLLGLAQEQGLIDRKDGITTISLTPFSFLALLRPQYVYDQELYEGVRELRHWGGTLAFGGKGDSFDRDGDGMADEALVAKNSNDIITWEVKYQFGSRDRRDPENFEPYFEAIKNDANAAVEVNAALGQLLVALDGELRVAGKTADPKGCFQISDLQEVFQKPAVGTAVAKLKVADKAVEAIATQVFDKVDRKPLFTLVLGGTERKDEFGPDKHTAALRSAFTRLGGTNSAELSWSEVKGLLGADDAVTLKLGYDYSRSFFKGSALWKDGVKLTVAGSYEKLRDVPMATHDTVGKLNAKFSIPLVEGMEIPISVTWANHKDLLTDEKEVQGHIGFTIDYSKVQDWFRGKE